MARPRSFVLVHGTMTGYGYGKCRCEPCKRAWGRYRLELRRKHNSVGLCAYCSRNKLPGADQLCKLCRLGVQKRSKTRRLSGR